MLALYRGGAAPPAGRGRPRRRPDDLAARPAPTCSPSPAASGSPASSTSPPPPSTYPSTSTCCWRALRSTADGSAPTRPPGCGCTPHRQHPMNGARHEEHPQSHVCRGGRAGPGPVGGLRRRRRRRRERGRRRRRRRGHHQRQQPARPRPRPRCARPSSPRVEEFEEANPDITIEPMEWEWEVTTFPSQLAGGTLPTTFELPFTYGQTLIERGQLQDITAEVEALPYADDFNPDVLAAGAGRRRQHLRGPHGRLRHGPALQPHAVRGRPGSTPTSRRRRWDEVREYAKADLRRHRPGRLRADDPGQHRRLDPHHR